MTYEAKDTKFNFESWDVEGQKAKLEELGGNPVEYPRHDSFEATESKGTYLVVAKDGGEKASHGDDGDKDKA